MAQNVPVNGIDSSASVGAPDSASPGLNSFQQLLYKDDLANTFMNTSEFAIEIEVFHSRMGAGGEWRTYNVIFDDPHSMNKIGDEMEFSTLKPQFMISDAELAMRILKTDRFRVNGIEYRCEDAITDGVGVTTVYMRVK